jgi:acetyltransferase-like isoleucine patch superfamily enzyme
VTELSDRDAHALGRALAEAHRDRTLAAATARAGVARLDAIVQGRRRRAGAAWRDAVRFAVERRMYTPDYLALYGRWLAHRLRHPNVDLHGLVFFAPRVQLHAPRHHARLAIGAWSWIGEATKLRAHEGTVRIGEKVVFGGDNVVNAYLDVEVGAQSLFGDWVYVTDFDHRHDRVDVAIRKQGIVKTPVRIGEDVWVGEKASILRGADVGAGSVIGSQTVVTGVIPAFSVAVGRPARVVRSRLPKGMTADEALALQRAGERIPGDPLDA